MRNISKITRQIQESVSSKSLSINWSMSPWFLRIPEALFILNTPNKAWFSRELPHTGTIFFIGMEFLGKLKLLRSSPQRTTIVELPGSKPHGFEVLTWICHKHVFKQFLSSSDPHQVTFYLTRILTFYLAFYLTFHLDFYPTFHLTFYLDIYIYIYYDILSGILSTINLTFFLAYTLTFYLTFFLTIYLTSILTYFLAYILTCFLAYIVTHSFWHFRTFYLPSVLEYFLTSVLTYFLAFYAATFL